MHININSINLEVFMQSTSFIDRNLETIINHFNSKEFEDSITSPVARENYGILNGCKIDPDLKQLFSVSFVISHATEDFF